MMMRGLLSLGLALVFIGCSGGGSSQDPVAEATVSAQRAGRIESPRSRAEAPALRITAQTATTLSQCSSMMEPMNGT